MTMADVSSNSTTAAYAAQTAAHETRAPSSSAVALQRSQIQDDLLAVLPNLRGFAISLTGDVQKADDVVHDTVVRALTYIDKFAPGTNLQAWMFTILRNQFHSNYRKCRHEVEDADGHFAARLSTAPAQDPQLDFEDLRLALIKLSVEQREAILLVGAEGFTYEEAARICSTRVGTIKSRVNRARTRLSELLGYEDVKDIGPDGLVRAALVSP